MGQFSTLCSIVVALLCAQSLTAAPMTVVVSGLGGGGDYQQQFDRYAATIAEQSRSISNGQRNTILMPGTASSREAILQTLASIARRKPESLSLYLIGHGSYDGHEYKFNVPGPDLSATDLSLALDKIDTRQLIVVATSASGALLESLQAPNRLVITATKNGRERNAVVFPRFIAEAIGEITADIDKNEVITVRELFDYAEDAVGAHYSSDKLLAPEHPRLRGQNADKYDVSRYGTLLSRANQISPQLLQERNSVSAEISSLRARKQEIDEDEYFGKLQVLMLELAAVQRKIDQEGAGQ